MVKSLVTLLLKMASFIWIYHLFIKTPLYTFFLSNNFTSNAWGWNLQKMKQMLSNILRLNFCYSHSLSTLSSKNTGENSRKYAKE